MQDTVKIVHGTSGNDVLDFSTVKLDKGVRVYAYEGNDVVFGTANKDVLLGGNGDDELHGGGGRDELNGDWGNDTLFGDSGSDFIYGSTGVNTLWGNTVTSDGKGGLSSVKDKSADFFVFGGSLDRSGKFVLDKGITTVKDFFFGEDFIKFANLGNGYQGSLANSRLEQRFDVAGLLSRDDKNLIVYQEKDAKGVATTKYVLENFFDGHNSYKDSKGVHTLMADDTSLNYVKDHISDFVVWA